MTEIEIIDKNGVGWKGGKRTKQYPGYETPKLKTIGRRLSKYCLKVDPSSPLNATLHGIKIDSEH